MSNKHISLIATKLGCEGRWDGGYESFPDNEISGHWPMIREYDQSIIRTSWNMQNLVIREIQKLVDDKVFNGSWEGFINLQ